MNLFDPLSVGLGLAVDGTQPASGAVAGILNGAKLHITASLVNTGPLASLADLLAAECTYTGYAAQTIVWAAAAVLSDDGNPENVATQLTFAATDAVTPNVGYCLFITNAGNSVLLYSGRLDTPVNFQDALHEAKITVRFRPRGTTLADVIS